MPLHLHRLPQGELEVLSLDPAKAVAQCYDGASAMFGVKSGVQEQMRVRYPNVIYIHCWAHRLNLALVNICIDTPGGNEFFNKLQSYKIY